MPTVILSTSEMSDLMMSDLMMSDLMMCMSPAPGIETCPLSLSGVPLLRAPPPSSSPLSGRLLSPGSPLEY